MATEIVTIAVPQGTSNHGDASLICAEARWYHVITFLFGNYITQSATIATRPGENVATTLKGLLLALFFPTTGIVRGIRAILQFALRRKTSLGAATGAGAMCVVVRSEEWLPQHGDHINFVKLETVKTEEPFVSKPFAMFNRAVGPKSFSVKFEGIEMDDLSYDDSPPTLNLRIDTAVEDGLEPMFLPSFAISDLGRRKVHGLCSLPPGYALRPVVLNSDVVLDEEHNHFERWTEENTEVFSRLRALTNPDTIHQPLRRNKAKEPVLISSRYSFSRAWLAILQIGYSYATMSRGLGDQIPTYGYAAFGLTFTPYLVMACLNLAGSLLTPDYPTMYLVDSDIMVEARKRGGRFEGVVGVAKTDKSRATGNGRGRITARFRCRDRSRSRSGRPKASSAALSGPPIADEVELFSAGRERTFKIHRSSSAIHEPQLNIPAHHPLTLDPKATSRIHRFRWILPIVAVLLSSISVFVNWYFSLFKRGNSTFAQRVWTMAWLIIGICIGLTMSLLPPLAWHSSDGIRKFFLASQMVCGVGAIGGLVVVVQMLNEYGVCWSF